MPDEMQRRDKLKPSDSPYASPHADTGGGSKFSLVSLLAVVAICVFGFGIMYYTIGLGVAFFIIAGLAFVRVKVHHRTAWATGIGASAVSALLMGVLVPICCSVAFFTNCLAGVFAIGQLGIISPAQGPEGVILAFGLGGVSALQTGELIVALLFGKRPKEINHETS